MHGQGIFTWSDGRIYKGEFQNNKKHGKGVYTYPDGKYYDGMWENGLQNGSGVFTSPEGKSRPGEWKNGKRLRWTDGRDSTTLSINTKLSHNTANTLKSKKYRSVTN